MDYEKAYNEALETARKINNGDGVAAPADWTVCETIFPVLREDYDDMIRGAIIDHLKDNNLTEWADWLEKQRKETSWKPSKEENIVRGIQKVEDIINTFEVKEVYLEKEYKDFIKSDNGRSMFETAKHFFELGLKVAQKGE